MSGRWLAVGLVLLCGGAAAWAAGPTSVQRPRQSAGGYAVR